MALITKCRDAGSCMPRILCLVVPGEMAGTAQGGSSCISVCMTGAAFRGDMGSGQRETGGAVIKSILFPGFGVVTLGAIGGVFQQEMVFGLVVVLLVAGDAFLAGTAGGSLVTVGTLPPGMASGESKPGCGRMVKF